MTIREIRRVLFETEKYTVIGADEMTNKESRDFLYAKDNQDETMNVIDNGSHLLIWKYNATKKEVKALKITSVDMETIYFDMNGVECATDLSAFADWVQEEIGNIEISQDYLNPTDGHGTIETVYSAWEWIYEMVQETKLNEVFFFDYLKLPKTIER